jgi:hypothetical protein
MDFTVFENYFVLSVVLACLIVGYIIKKWIKDVDNKYIPTIVTVVGMLLNLAVSGVSIESAIFGAFMGLASTGLHQAFKQYIEKDKE